LTEKRGERRIPTGDSNIHKKKKKDLIRDLELTEKSHNIDHGGSIYEITSNKLTAT
jgi:hypothetical protein